MAAMTQEWHPQIPDWALQGGAWIASLVAAGSAKPVFDWWRQRDKDRREAKAEEIDAATELREELRVELRGMRAELKQREAEIDVVRREMYELMGKLAALTAENHELRALDHRIRNWLSGFYATLQMRWKSAGLPMEDFPTVPSWIHQSPPGPTASFPGEQEGEP